MLAHCVIDAALSLFSDKHIWVGGLPPDPTGLTMRRHTYNDAVIEQGKIVPLSNITLRQS